MADIIKENMSKEKEKMKEVAGETVEKAGEQAKRLYQVVQRAIPENVSRDFDEKIAQLPPMAFLGLALASMGVSATLALSQEKKGWANFFGMWVPSLLFLTLYSKMAKLEQSGKIQRVPTVH